MKRTLLKKIKKKLFKGKVLVLYGARQVGKTTLMNQLMEGYKDSLYLNADEPDVRSFLENKTSSELKSVIGNTKLIIIDEAQRIENIGITLKLLVDNFPDQQVIATGSSSFDLANKIIEPLTGRHFEFFLPPLSVKEIAEEMGIIEEKRQRENRMIYGMYPEVVLLPSNAEKEIHIRTLAKSYIYKDILALYDIKNAKALETLLQALALQIGSEVSYNELAQTVGIDKNTINRYLDILEQSFIIFRISSFSKNLRNELKKSKKIFFWDLGIRNAILGSFSPLSLRNDTGGLWENFVIAERIKYQKIKDPFSQFYFWRTHQRQEIDLIEQSGKNSEKLKAYEIKWNENKKIKPPKLFLETYEGSQFEVITQENFLEFVSD